MTSEATHVGAANDHEPVSRALAHDRRRTALSILADADVPMAEADLAVELARRESGEDDLDRAREHRISLYHCDLPKLDAAGLVDRDPDSRTVELAAQSGAAFAADAGGAGRPPAESPN